MRSYLENDKQLRVCRQVRNIEPGNLKLLSSCQSTHKDHSTMADDLVLALNLPGRKGKGSRADCREQPWYHRRKKESTYLIEQQIQPLASSSQPWTCSPS